MRKQRRKQTENAARRDKSIKKKGEKTMASKIKQFFGSLTLKQMVFSLIVIFSLVLWLIITIWSNHKINGLIDQQAAARWDEEGGSAQVSCFLSEGVEMDELKIIGFEKELEKSLLEVLPADAQSSENGKRLFIDAYSSMGKITVASEKGKLEANAVGIGGDFFLFHPLQLVSGGYFSGNDLMKDSIILDEDAAWQLFGSNDIAGQSVMIGGVPHYVSGVIKRPTGKFAESAGLKETVIFVSNETLTAHGQSSGISIYEVVAPNPVKNFVYKCVKEKLGVKEDDMVVVENSARYSLESLIPVILEFGNRSMQNYAVKLPYWENIARGWEDIKSLVLLCQFVLLLVPGVIILVFLVIKWKNRNFTWKDVGHYIIDTKDRVVQKVRASARREKDKWEHF